MRQAVTFISGSVNPLLDAGQTEKFPIPLSCVDLGPWGTRGDKHDLAKAHHKAER